jgi:hypothetical protein
VLKFLVDECLSLDLVEVARSRGFPESSHVGSQRLSHGALLAEWRSALRPTFLQCTSRRSARRRGEAAW